MKGLGYVSVRLADKVVLSRIHDSIVADLLATYPIVMPNRLVVRLRGG